MAWTGLALTVEGRNALNQAQLSNTINFKSIVVGDGKAPANFGTQRELVHQLYEITAIKVDVIDGGCTITADFPEVVYDYYFREIGIIVTTDAGDILYVYDNCGEDAQYIVSSTGVETTKKRIRLSLAISDVEEITISEPQILYVSYDDYESAVNRLETEIENNKVALGEEITRESERAEKAEEQLKKDIGSEAVRATEAEEELRRQKLNVDGDASDVTVDFNEAEDLILLDGLHKLSELFGASAKAVSSLIAHLEDKDNPHEVSREQMQVDKVDNTSDMEKPVSTAQQAALDALHTQLAAYTDKAVADLINGAPSTLDTLGEIAKAMEENADVVSALNEAIGKKANEVEFDSHVKDTTAHVTAAEREAWNSKLSIAGGTVSGSIDVAGVVNAGGKAKIWTDSEGGNLLLIAPDGTRWEADAVDGNLRIFTYANGVKVGLTINQYGQVTFVNGAWSDDFHGTLYGAVSAQGGVGGRGTQMSANGFHIDLPPEEGYAGGLTWYQGNAGVGCFGYYKQGGYHYVGTDYAAPNGELRTGVIRAGNSVYVQFPYALYVRHIEGADGGNLFLNYNNSNMAVVVGDTSSTGTGYGSLNIGTKVNIRTDNEGGNFRFQSPSGVNWEMDAHDDYFRLYGYPEGTYYTFIKAFKNGMTDFPQGVLASYIMGRASAYSSYITIVPILNNSNTSIKIGAFSINSDMVTHAIWPQTDGYYCLGLPSNRVAQVYAVNSAISTSDERLKIDIQPLDENLIQSFILGLNPISYIRTDGESGRTHYGLGAQSVERLMEEIGMTSMDFAGLIKSPATEEYEVEEEVEVEKLIPNENGKPIPQTVKEIQKVTKQREIPGEYRYGLRYEEFIAPTIKFCQMLQAQVDDLKMADKRRHEEMNTLKAENQELKDRLARVEKMHGI